MNIRKLWAESDHLELRVRGISSLVRGTEATFIYPLDDIKAVDPRQTKFVVDDSPGFSKSLVCLEAQYRRTPPSNNSISLGHKAALDTTNYQLVPAQKALDNLRPRILIGDAVGLGKTLEVGILLTELERRGLAGRILVLTPKAVLEQFQREMWTRFSIPLVRLDSNGLERIKRTIPSNKNPFSYYDRVIASIDTLKREEASFFRYLRDTWWDVVVIDECHNVAKNGSYRNKLASLISKRCDSLILASATPHNGKREDFATLLRLLDPTTVADPSNLEKSDVVPLVTRRFKKDVKDEVSEKFRERQNHFLEVSADDNEENVLDFLSTRLQRLRTQHSKKKKTDGLFAITLLKAFLSSAQACRAILEKRLVGTEKKSEKNDDFRKDLESLQEFSNTLNGAERKSRSKINKLISELRQIGFTGKSGTTRVLVFSEYIETLKYLEKELTAAFSLPKNAVAVLHASLPDVEQDRIVDEFGMGNSPLRLLLASDVASEGVNLHFSCHHLFHYDIPWSIITFEQRNGRIDRFGQQNDPHIFSMILKSQREHVKSDLRVLEILVKKEEEISKTMGDVRLLSKLYNAELEESDLAAAILDQQTPDWLTTGSGADFLSLLMDDDSATSAAQAPSQESSCIFIRNETTASPAVLMDTALFVREALRSVIDPNEISIPPGANDWPRSLTIPIKKDSDIERRIERILPREARPSKGNLSLLMCRDLMKARIKEAQKNAGSANISEAAPEEGSKNLTAWPAQHFCWPLHPAVSWLEDRAMAVFGRGRAPVVQTNREHAPLFLFQGLQFSVGGKPILARWFAVEYKNGSTAILSFDDFMKHVKLNEYLHNSGDNSSLTWLSESLVDSVVDVAEYYMEQQSKEITTALKARSESFEKKLSDWHSRRKEAENSQIQALLDIDNLKKNPGLLARHQRRYNAAISEIDEQARAYEEFIQNRLEPGGKPFLRIAALFMGEVS